MVQTALDQGVGYGIVLGLGFGFALGMVSARSAALSCERVNLGEL